MKKFFCISGLVFSLFKFIESLLFDLMPALSSSETAAYKAGVVLGIFLILLAAIGYSYWTYPLFITPDGNTNHASA
ncbi:hypothetical protein [Fodinibius salsisoli]|uniref:Uncharacterized protein n=1 Tax=Fodinibius salsisoli TaxID=2820877 RepID=A0ABT3PRJ7_9BACT|nr:hypothetical protein [Fodinibius salsisoli]MCW9708488.1 hypothetical protein [Fodinibius salsisoli]